MSQLQPRGKKGIYTWISDNGQWKSTGTSDLTAAKALQIKWDRQLFYSMNGLVDKDMTWADYREEYERLYESTHAHNSSVKLNYILNTFERIMKVLGCDLSVSRLSVVNMVLCEEWQSVRLREVTHQTVDTEQKYLEPFFKKAHQRGYIERNPFVDIPRVKFVPTEAKCLTFDEAKRFLGELETDGELYNLLGIFVYDTGMRRDEVAHQRIEDVDFVRGLVQVRNHAPACVCHQCEKSEFPGWKTKTGRERVVPLSPRLQTMLLGLFQKQKMGCIFPIHPLTITEVFKRAYARAKVDGKVGVHTLRHMMANDLRRAGVDEEIRKAILGHAKTSAHETYMHVDVGELQAAMARLLEWRKGQETKIKRLYDSGFEIIEAQA